MNFSADRFVVALELTKATHTWYLFLGMSWRLKDEDHVPQKNHMFLDSPSTTIKTLIDYGHRKKLDYGFSYSNIFSFDFENIKITIE